MKRRTQPSIPPSPRVRVKYYDPWMSRGRRATPALHRAECLLLLSWRAQAGSDFLELSQSLNALGVNAMNGGDSDPLRVTLGVLADGVQVNVDPMSNGPRPRPPRST